ncbi:PHD finger protein 21B isoform X3 [Nelusetta ayraudi]|uniref:PHD finger protein 21B isoform X3 n=1 Tax=Nelusetta ayraudi TaxID=303726 RepID=UPI003F7096B5
MELQGLQEALKVEIQCHQNQTLCKSLNELQNGQKLAVRACPVGGAKPLALTRPPGPGLAISVVTPHLNGQRVELAPPQVPPTNLQTGAITFASRTAVELPPPQMLGTLIKVPQVSSLHRLAGHAATLLPQVRPKTHIPDSLPRSPCQEPAPLGQQRATAVVSPPSQGAATLPTANSTLSPDGGPDSAPLATAAAQHATAGTGVAYAIIAASPANGNRASAVSEAVKVIIIQPQAPSGSEGSPENQASVPSQDSPCPSPSRKRHPEDPEKLAFMVALGLVTPEQAEEIQLKRHERKRRSTANPAYSGLFEPERKRLASHYLDSSLYLTARDSDDVCWKEEEEEEEEEEVEHEEHCAICREDGELQLCHGCPRAFHPDCLQPPLKTPPAGGPWYCHNCQKKVLNKENVSWPHNFIQSYVTHKTVREEEKRRLLRRNGELKNECSHLEEQEKELNDTLKHCVELRDGLRGQQRDTQASLQRLKELIRLIQREQVIQVTMTASLLTQSWIKATSRGPGGPPGGPGAPATPGHHD